MSKRLTVVCVNWGRGYKPGELRANVAKVVNRFEDLNYVAYLVQELDEADAADEHAIFLRELDPPFAKTAWKTHEPIVVDGKAKIGRPRCRITMKAGLEIGAPEGTGPRRYAVTCIAELGLGIEVGLGNTHPHRNMQHPKVQTARRQGEKIFRDQLQGLYEAQGGTSVVWGADTNDLSFPQMLSGERTAIKRGLDVIRYKSHPKGARLKVLKTGTLAGTIDGHDPIWATFEVA
jgi:hypothetical protein